MIEKDILKDGSHVSEIFNTKGVDLLDIDSRKYMKPEVLIPSINRV